MRNGSPPAATNDAPRVTYVNPSDPLPRQWLIRAVELASGQPRLNALYREYHQQPGPAEDLWLAAVRKLRLQLRFDESRLAAVPRDGPLVIVANHPFGVVDGLVGCMIADRLRGRFKLLAHSALFQAPEARSFVLPIDFTETRDALRRNIASRRQAIDCLAEGGAVLIFPAGRVSTAEKLRGRATDSPWKPFAARLVIESRATVLPIYFEGQNAWLFHFVSRFSEALREALLMREVVRRIGAEIVAHIGTPIAYDDIAHLRDRHQLVDWLRQTTYALAPSPA